MKQYERNELVGMLRVALFIGMAVFIAFFFWPLVASADQIDPKPHQKEISNILLVGAGINPETAKIVYSRRDAVGTPELDLSGMVVIEVTVIDKDKNEFFEGQSLVPRERVWKGMREALQSALAKKVSANNALKEQDSKIKELCRDERRDYEECTKFYEELIEAFENAKMEMR